MNHIKSVIVFPSAVQLKALSDMPKDLLRQTAVIARNDEKIPSDSDMEHIQEKSVVKDMNLPTGANWLCCNELAIYFVAKYSPQFAPNFTFSKYCFETFTKLGLQ